MKPNCCSNRLFRSVALGQTVSLFVAGTGICSQYLSRLHVNVPATQSVLNYVLLSSYIIFHCAVKRRRLNVAWWKYLLLAIADVEANYLVVKAYQYTTITSVMLFDCATIPFSMVFSFFLLKARYRVMHYVGVGVCIVGLVLLAISDVTQDGPGDTSGSRRALGDFLCVCGSVLYALSNVGQESVVKVYRREEFLGMIGAFGMVIGGLQLAILETSELKNLAWSGEVVGLILGFVACLFCMYSLTSVFLSWSDATLFNLSLLTSDLWSVLAAVFLFDQTLDVYYFLAFAATATGIALYNLAGAPTKPVHNWVTGGLPAPPPNDDKGEPLASSEDEVRALIDDQTPMDSAI